MSDSRRNLEPKITDWRYFQDGLCLQILIYLLAKSRKTPTTFKGNVIKRGETVVSRGALTVAVGATEQPVRTRLEWFEEDGVISKRRIVAGGIEYGVFKLLNFEEHQFEEKPKKEPMPSAPKPATRFVKPTVEQVAEYVAERVKLRKPEICPETFFNFYESKGWQVGKSGMKDWKASIRTWEQKERENGNACTYVEPSQKREHVPSQMWKDFDQLGGNFMARYGMSKADFADKVRVDIADLTSADFGRKYRVIAADALHTINDRKFED